MKSKYDTLRLEIEFALRSAELDGIPVEKAAGDLIKLALTLAVAVQGPARTAAQVSALLTHLRESFPSVFGEADFPPTMGNA